MRCLRPASPTGRGAWKSASLSFAAGGLYHLPAPALTHKERERERERPSEKDSHASSLPFSQQRSALAAQPAADAAARSASGATHSNADEYARFAADPARKHVTWPKLLNASLAEVDPVLVDIIEKEKNRQWKVKEENTRERV